MPGLRRGPRTQTRIAKSVKLLLDENLPPRLADVLQSEFSGSIHVHAGGLGGADDEAIWEYARREGFTIVSKDSDFQERSVLCGSPPKVFEPYLRDGTPMNVKLNTSVNVNVIKPR